MHDFQAGRVKRAGEGVQGYWYLAGLVHGWQGWGESWVSASTKGVARWLFALFQPPQAIAGLAAAHGRGNTVGVMQAAN